MTNLPNNAEFSGLQAFSGQQYLSQGLVQNFLAQLDKHSGALLAHPYFVKLGKEDFSSNEQSLWQQVQLWQQLIHADNQTIIDYNHAYTQQEIERYQELFSQVESYPLTEEQQRAVVCEEDRQLLIASAGSGKSSTLVAKVAYLLKKGLAQPHQICVLAYNEEAARSISERIAKMQNKLQLFCDGQQLQGQCYSATFHALGLAVLRAQGQNVALSSLASANRNEMMAYLQSKVESLLQEEDFAHSWYDYLALAKKPRPNLFAFKTQKAYYDYLSQMGASYAASKEGKKRPIFTALNGTKVSSMETLMIANWLVSQGVEFRYLQPLSGSKNRNALADFYFPRADLYHFHFALNAEKKWPIFLSDYGSFIDKKRKAAQRFKADYIETTSAQFDDGTILQTLKQQLHDEGVEFNPLSNNELAQLVNKQYQPEDDLPIFEAFLRHFKANGGDTSAFDQELAQTEVNDPIRTTLFLEIFKPLYQAYQDDLQSVGQIDFNDQINLACEQLENRQFVHPFTYILVDEFQDISQDRKRLLQALLNQNSQCKLMAVGDDWQSIYRFSGADIDIMTHFSNHFDYAATNYLTQTFRCYQGIADVAAQFVQQNPEQLRKEVKAHADINVDQVRIEAYESESDQLDWVQKLLWRLNSTAEKRGIQLSVYLLARYHRQRPDNLLNYQARYSSLQIQFKTIHASKGLEADYVILMGLESGSYGFPSERSDDPILHLVIPQPEAFSHAEERRLLYVALTRAKRGVFVLSNAVDRSEFVTQLGNIERVQMSDKLVEVELCPKCHSGKMQERRGPYSIFLGCSNYPACDHSEKKICPKCETGYMAARESEHGRFYGCSTYPKCDYIDQ
nr:UvrD-helicase domain-containing protein [Thiomicrorhabdus marina]